MMQQKEKAVVLLSGGLDSATCLAIAQSEGFDCYTLTFQYGQRHQAELDAARKIMDHAKIPANKRHQIAFDLREWGGSALTSDIEVPDADLSGSAVPVTYVPARNTIFLSFAAALAETIGAKTIFVGVNSLDYSNYPDCRPAFIQSFALTATLGTKAVDDNWVFDIRAPLQYLTKAEIIQKGLELGVDYGLTHSCYNPGADGTPCLKCDSCALRQRAFAELGMKDPAIR
jgi:7-cyano-7-deazaguanine synthase